MREKRGQGTGKLDKVERGRKKKRAYEKKRGDEEIKREKKKKKFLKREGRKRKGKSMPHLFHLPWPLPHSAT